MLLFIHVCVINLKIPSDSVEQNNWTGIFKALQMDSAFDLNSPTLTFPELIPA